MSDLNSPILAYKYNIDDYNHWDHTIMASAQDFKFRFGGWPNILIANRDTLQAFDLFMSRKLIKEGMVETVQSISTFATREFELAICLDEQNDLSNHEFVLVYYMMTRQSL
jgi:hypothetical protein